MGRGNRRGICGEPRLIRRHRMKLSFDVQPGQKQQWKEELYAKNPRCYWCGKKVLLIQPTRGKPDPPNMATLDHFKPFDDGGTWEMSNLLLSCKRCNNIRGKHPSPQIALQMKLGNLDRKIEEWEAKKDNPFRRAKLMFLKADRRRARKMLGEIGPNPNEK